MSAAMNYIHLARNTSYLLIERISSYFAKSSKLKFYRFVRIRFLSQIYLDRENARSVDLAYRA